MSADAEVSKILVSLNDQIAKTLNVISIMADQIENLEQRIVILEQTE